MTFSEGLLKAYLGVFGIILLSTEVLSATGLINAAAIRILWLFILAGVLIYWLQRRRHASAPPIRQSGPAPWAIVISATLLLGTLLAALIYPPNN